MSNYINKLCSKAVKSSRSDKEFLEKLDNLEWNVPTDFIVGFGKTDVRKEQSKFWGNVKGSKDQLARGYRRVRL